ncbi:MAG: phosphoribosylglycinamide formyltransferase [Bdellovibrionota bacterium]
MTKIVVLASGSGSNAEAIIRFAHQYKSYEVAAVISDRPEALVLQRAKNFKIEAHVVEKTKTETKVSFEQRLVYAIRRHQPDWVVLAGFMKLLSGEFLQNFYDSEIKHFKVVNIHPSLLPLYPGKDAYEQSFKAQASEYGCTIHFVDEGMDTGKIIFQERLKAIEDESFEDFKARGLAAENRIYPIILEKLFKEYSI